MRAPRTAAPQRPCAYSAYAHASTLPPNQLATLTEPATIAYGASSPPVAAAIKQALTELLPNADLREITGARHGMLDTHPKNVAEMHDQARKT